MKTKGGRPRGGGKDVYKQNIVLPGVLLLAILRRVAELGRGSLSRYIVELICYDLRRRRQHDLTAPLAHELPEHQEAVDREIDRHYVEGVKSNYARMEQLVNGTLAEAKRLPLPPGSLAKHTQTVLFRRRHRRIIQIRWKELGFKCVSQYVTSLIRFDLALGGPHHEFKEEVYCRKTLLALDRETIAEFHAAKERPKKCLVDYVMEKVAGRPLSLEDRHRILREASERLKASAIAAQRAVRREVSL